MNCPRSYKKLRKRLKFLPRCLSLPTKLLARRQQLFLLVGIFAFTIFLAGSGYFLYQTWVSGANFSFADDKTASGEALIVETNNKDTEDAGENDLDSTDHHHENDKGKS